MEPLGREKLLFHTHLLGSRPSSIIDMANIWPLTRILYSASYTMGPKAAELRECDERDD